MSKRADFPCPMIKRSFNSYPSPVTGEIIQTRKERERDLVRHDCVPSQDVKPTGNKALPGVNADV